MSGNVTATYESIQQYFGLSFYIRIVACGLSPCILLGNGMTVVTATRFVTRVTPTHVAITYLAVVDFMIGLTPWFHLTTYLTQGYKHWKNWCTFTAWVDCFLVTQNTTAIMLVAVERCFCITKWNWYRNKYTVVKQKLVSGASCLLYLLTSTIYIILGGVDPKYGNCYFKFINNWQISYMYTLIFVVLFSVFILCYKRIIHFLWKGRKSVAEVGIQTISSHHSRMTRTTSLMALIVTIYTLTTVPISIYFVTLSENVTKKQVEILNIFIFVYYCNGIVNPIIYAFRIPEFKRAYRKILDRICKTKKNRVDVMNTRGNKMNRPHGSRRINVPLEPRRFSFRLESRRDLDTMFRTCHM